MRKILYASLIAALSIVAGCHFWQSSNSITSITSFHEVNFDALQKGALVVFDVDETLIQRSDAYLSNLNSEQADIFNATLFAKHPDLPNDFVVRILQQADKVLIEPEIITIIERLLLRSIPVIACTNMINEAPFGNYTSTLDWRYQQLKALGFQGSFSDTVINLDQFERKPVFYKGILVTDLEAKGLVIGAFLDVMHVQPKYIVMFDDRWDNLISAQEECKKRDIVFTGYHYLGTFAVPWDEDLATFQLEHFIRHGIWLSDAQAQQVRNTKPAVAH